MTLTEDLYCRAVVFDLDGCLVDSEPLSLEAVAAQMREVGITDATADEVGARFLGVAIPVIADYAADRLGHPCPPDFAARIEARLLARYETDLRRIPGARALLDGFRGQGTDMAIATGGSLKRMDVTLTLSGLKPYFPTTACSAEEVARGKPAPDLFELAAKRLGIDPTDCIVLEDSPHGVKGAIAAGMRPVGFVGGAHLAGKRKDHAEVLRASGAVTVIDDLAQLAAMIAPKGANR